MRGRWVETAALAGVCAMALAGCHPAKFGEGRNGADRALTVADRLDCPERQGGLTRTEQAADGRSCKYTGDGGEEATLAFLPLDGKTPEAALAATEASFHALLPRDAKTATASANATADTDDADGDSDDDSGDRGDKSGRSSGDHDHVAINLPGLHIDADDGGAKVRAFGQHVVADEKGAKVDSAINGVKSTIVADDGGAEIRSGFVGKQAVDLTYILASDAQGPSGAHAAAYVARGPIGGPLVLASGTLRDGDRHVDKDRFDALRDLVGRNVKGAKR